MVKKFDADEYVSRWDKRMIPIMIATIVLCLVAVVALNRLTKPDCTVHDYVFCGTDLTPVREGGHAKPHKSHDESAEPAGHGAVKSPHGAHP